MSELKKRADEEIDEDVFESVLEEQEQVMKESKDSFGFAVNSKCVFKTHLVGRCEGIKNNLLQ